MVEEAGGLDSRPCDKAVAEAGVVDALRRLVAGQNWYPGGGSGRRDGPNGVYDCVGAVGQAGAQRGPKGSLLFQQERPYRWPPGRRSRPPRCGRWTQEGAEAGGQTQ